MSTDTALRPDHRHESADLQARVLLIDADADSSLVLATALRAWGYELTLASDLSALERAHSGMFDLLMLDPQEGRGQGWQCLGELRTRSRLPVLALLGENAVLDRVLALEMGADAVMAKSCDLRELRLRLQGLLRRSREERPLHFGRWRLDAQTRRLRGPGGFNTSLAPAEYRLLRAFLERPHSVLCRQELLELVRGQGAQVLERSVDLLISRLRQKLEDDAREPQLIRTIRGVGYLFEPPEA
jgi:two-component system, OmpR family, response regulator